MKTGKLSSAEEDMLFSQRLSWVKKLENENKLPPPVFICDYKVSEAKLDWTAWKAFVLGLLFLINAVFMSNSANITGALIFGACSVLAVFFVSMGIYQFFFLPKVEFRHKSVFYEQTVKAIEKAKVEREKWLKDHKRKPKLSHKIFITETDECSTLDFPQGIDVEKELEYWENKA